MGFDGGRIVMTLEGGYNLDSIANSILACVEVLLEDKNITIALKDYPFDSTWQVYNWYTTIYVIFRSLCDYILIIMTARNYSDNCLQVRKELFPYWPILAEKLPEKLTEGKHLKFRYCSPFFCTY